MKTLVVKPRVSEKAYGHSQAFNTYVFDVPLTANKQIITQAIQAQFNVTVDAVRVTTVKGKVKRFVTGGRSKFGNRKDIKKAYVTLKKGDSLPVFAAVAEEKSEAKPAKKAAKTEAKDKK